MKIRLPNNGWRPRPDQMTLWAYLENGGKRAVEVAHRRWGKDDVGLHFTATVAMQRIGNYWHMLPQYGQGRKAIWDAINPKTGLRRIDEAFPLAIRKATNKTEMKIELRNGSIWQVVGSDTYNTIVGSPPVGLVLSEWAIANPMAWAYLAPILEENNGWALFIYTSRGNNHGKSTYEHAQVTPGWFAEKLRADQTPVFNATQLDNIKAEYTRIFGKELGTAMFEQEYMCSWEGAILGAYFAEQMREARSDGRITRVPHQVGQEVDTFWDLGIDDSTSIWFMQPVGQGFNFIDYYSNTGKGFEHYAKVLKDKDYLYGNHYMPHDARQRVLDAREVAITKQEHAENAGIKPIEVVERVRNNDILIHVHIPAMRNILNKCWFDEDRCVDGINALENYRAEYDDEKKKLGNRPIHDWSSHGTDAFRTFAVGWHGIQPEVHLTGGVNMGASL